MRENNLIEDKLYRNVTIRCDSEEGDLRRLEIKEKLLKGYMKEREEIIDLIS